MLHEIRLYAIPPGRIADIEQRMLRDVPQLFAEHGMRVVGHWIVLAGPNLPAFLYILEWRDSAERESHWQSFYNDQRWWDIRLRTNAGSELVESYGLWLMKAHPVWQRPFTPVVKVSNGELHEMLIHLVDIGRGPLVVRHLQDSVLPAIAQAGGRTLAVLDLVSGPRFPAVALFFAWPDFQSRTAGRTSLEQIRAPGAAFMGRSDVYLLRPVIETVNPIR